MAAVQGFLSSYSANLQLALLAWPFFSVFLTLPILAYLYHRDGRLRFSAVCGTYISVLYLLSIACFAFYPLPAAETGPGITYGVPPQWNPFGFIGDIAQDGLKAVFQLLFNIVFFMPLGFIAGYLLGMRARTAILLSFAVSAMVELAQLTGLFGLYDYAYRCCDVDDLICNTLGGALGWLCARALGCRCAMNAERPETTRSPGFLRRCVAFWIDMSLASFVATITWVGVALLSSVLWGHPLEIPPMGQEQTLAVWQTTVMALMFVVLEIVIPWFHDGSTIGGAFVRMTCETRDRTLSCRIFFYAMRTLTIVAALALAPLMFPLLAIYYFMKRCMPYDMVPGNDAV